MVNDFPKSTALLVSAAIPSLVHDESAICQGVALDQRETIDDLAYQTEHSKRKVALLNVDNYIIHGRLNEYDTCLEIRHFAISRPEIPEVSNQPLRFQYKAPVISNVVFTKVDQHVYCWLLSSDRNLIRHRFTLSDLQSGDLRDEHTWTKPIASLKEKEAALISASPHGFLTITCADGTLVHVQDMQQHSVPEGLEHVKILSQGKAQRQGTLRETDAKRRSWILDNGLCEFQLVDKSTFNPLNMLRRLASYVGLEWDRVLTEPSIQERIVAFATQEIRVSERVCLDVIAGVLKDCRLCIWTHVNNGGSAENLHQTLVELPRFGSDGQLIDPEKLDMTYELPGSFHPKEEKEKKSILYQTAPANNHRVQFVRHGGNKLKIVAYVDTNSPFFAVYDAQIGSNGCMDIVTLTDVIMGPNTVMDGLVDIAAGVIAHEKSQELKLWTIGKHKDQLSVSISTTDLSSGAGSNYRVHTPDWTLATQATDQKVEFDTTVSEVCVVDNHDILIATYNDIFAVQSLRPVDTLYYELSRDGKHSSESRSLGSDQSLDKASRRSGLPMSSAFSKALSRVSGFLDSTPREILDLKLENSYHGAIEKGAESFYNDFLKQHETSLTIPEFDADAVKLILESLREQKVVEKHETASSAIETLVCISVSHLIRIRQEILLHLVALLCFAVFSNKQTDLSEELVEAMKMLKTYDALGWALSQTLKSAPGESQLPKQTKSSTMIYPAPNNILQSMMEKVYHVSLPAQARLDISSTAYELVVRLGNSLDTVAELCNSLTVMEEDQLSLEMMEKYFGSDGVTLSGSDSESNALKAVKFYSFLAHDDMSNSLKALQTIDDKYTQDRLLKKFIEHAYEKEEYSIICRFSIEHLKPKLGEILRQRVSALDAKGSKRLTWWQVAYSFFALSGEMALGKERVLRKVS